MKKNDIFVKKIIHEIRNMKPLDNNIIDSISNLSNDDKMIIIMEYNIVVGKLKQFIEETL